jgi:hypothetical protein
LGDVQLTTDTYEDLLPVQFERPSVLAANNYQYRVSVESNASSWKVAWFRNAGYESDPTAHITTPQGGLNLLKQSALAVCKTAAPAQAITLDKDSLILLAHFSATGTYYLHLQFASPGSTNWADADCVKVTVHDPAAWFYSTVSFRGTKGDETFAYPYEDRNGVMTTSPIPIYPRLQSLANMSEYRDVNKQKYLVFLHGFNVKLSEALGTGKTLFKRIYWSGYRQNFIAITWEGDDYLLPALWDLKAYFTDPLSLFTTDHLCEFWGNVNNALHTSPNLYYFLHYYMSQTWGVDHSQINIMAHSLGNMVMWDALRLNQYYNHNQLVNNVIGVEPAVWPEAFAEKKEEVYNSANDAPITYSVAALQQCSWKFWFRQSECDATQSIGGTYAHSFEPTDYALDAMQLADYLAHFAWGLTDTSSDLAHYNRSSTRNGRYPENLACFGGGTPTLMKHDERNVKYGRRYDKFLTLPNFLGYSYRKRQLNQPAGCQALKMENVNMESQAAAQNGWTPNAHSDFTDLGIYTIYGWYENFLFPKITQ